MSMKPLLFPVWKLSLFALLNLADFGLTWHLLDGGGGAVYESNPVAEWCLTNHGWEGLAGLKAASVLVAGGLAVVIFRCRPRAGHRLLTFSCATVAVVVLYSCYLVGASTGFHPEAARLAEYDQRFDEQFRLAADYRAVLDQIAADLEADRCDLASAVVRLERTQKATDPAWRSTLRCLYPGFSDQGCLAVNVVQYSVARCRLHSSRNALARRLQAEFHALYGTPFPLPYLNGIPVAAEGRDDAATHFSSSGEVHAPVVVR